MLSISRTSKSNPLLAGNQNAIGDQFATAQRSSSSKMLNSSATEISRFKKSEDDLHPSASISRLRASEQIDRLTPAGSPQKNPSLSKSPVMTKKTGFVKNSQNRIFSLLKNCFCLADRKKEDPAQPRTGSSSYPRSQNTDRPVPFGIGGKKA